MKRLTAILIKYECILKFLYTKKPTIFGNLLHIGLNEILDHLNLLDLADSGSKKNIYFDDLKIYLQESILDCRSMLIKPVVTQG